MIPRITVLAVLVAVLAFAACGSDNLDFPGHVPTETPAPTALPTETPVP